MSPRQFLPLSATGPLSTMGSKKLINKNRIRIYMGLDIKTFGSTFEEDFPASVTTYHWSRLTVRSVKKSSNQETGLGNRF